MTNFSLFRSCDPVTSPFCTYFDCETDWSVFQSNVNLRASDGDIARQTHRKSSTLEKKVLIPEHHCINKQTKHDTIPTIIAPPEHLSDLRMSEGDDLIFKEDMISTDGVPDVGRHEMTKIIYLQHERAAQ